jgi:hypothetical protein
MVGACRPSTAAERPLSSMLGLRTSSHWRRTFGANPYRADRSTAQGNALDVRGMLSIPTPSGRITPVRGAPSKNHMINIYSNC